MYRFFIYDYNLDGSIYCYYNKLIKGDGRDIIMNNIALRGKLYKLSSLLLLYPREDLFDKICKYIDDIHGISPLSSRLRRDVDEVKNIFCEKEVSSDIKLNYTKLFVTYHPTTLCPPYVHIYLNLNPVDIEYSLTQLLKNLKLSIREGYRDLKNNYSLLFELLYFSTLIEDRRGGEELERGILTRFIFPSIDKFIGCVKRNDNIYYDKVARFLRDFIEELRIYL
jgi:nitrate reductase assembly molybdenum cofactor insertion protein NarJ